MSKKPPITFEDMGRMLREQEIEDPDKWLADRGIPEDAIRVFSTNAVTIFVLQTQAGIPIELSIEAIWLQGFSQGYDLAAQIHDRTDLSEITD